MLIDTERDLYRQCFDDIEAYQHSPGASYVPLFLEMAAVPSIVGGSVLDAGTGTGAGAVALAAAGLGVTGFDLEDWRAPSARHLPFVAGCLWEDVVRRTGVQDYVYCCDVLEHVPPEYTMLVVSRLLAVARKGCFFSIATRPDQLGVWVGQVLHKTVRSFVWWRDALDTIGRVGEARDLLGSGLYWVLPRR